jgi:lipopolysaccharide transport system permease protein
MERSAVVCIVAPGGAKSLPWRELWAYRELIATLTVRDLALRFRQTVMGVAWIVLKPLVTMVVLTIIFGHVAKLPTNGQAPYPLIVLAGILPWSFFSTALGEITVSLVNNATLISKVYFPRIIIPTALLGTFLVDVLINLGLMLLLMIYYQFTPPWTIVFLPAFLILAALATLGPGLLFAALCVKYRDFRNIVPFGLQIGMFISPVGYLSSNISSDWRFIYSFNPLVGIIDGFRWALLGTESPYWPGLLVGIGVVLVALWIGVRQFQKAERAFADLI